MKKVKIGLAHPWYDGPDRDCFAQYLVFQHYLGRLQERLYWYNRFQERWAEDARQFIKAGGLDTRPDSETNTIPPLDPVNLSGSSEIPASLIGTQFEFLLSEEGGCSLPGMARERCVDNLLRMGADVILFWDDDMLFGTDAFLRLYQDDKDVVAALAFTARKPITPVIYKFKYGWHKEKNCEHIDIEPVWNYKRDELQKVDAVGSGMVMIKADAFAKVERPWFHSTGLGEDIWFCHKCHKAGVDVWVDTRVKTIHKPTFVETWHDERAFDSQQEKVSALQREEADSVA